MGFRWRKSFGIFPGFRLNLSHRGARAQIGGSPLSFSFRLFGGSKARRLTASLPPTGLSFVATSVPQEEAPAADPPEAMVEAFKQAANLRLVPLMLSELPNQPIEVQRQVTEAAVSIFLRIMDARGATRDPAGVGPEVIREFPDEKVMQLVREVVARS